MTQHRTNKWNGRKKLNKSDIRTKQRAARFIPDQKWTDHLTVGGQVFVHTITQSHIIGRIAYCGMFTVLLIMALCI